MMTRLGWGAALFLAAIGCDAEPLPEPLTLAAALEHADYDMPALALERASLELSAAERAAVVAETGLRSGLEGRLRAVEPSTASTNSDWNDSSARLYLRKRLYDGGVAEARQRAAQSAEEHARLGFVDARQKRSLQIMRAFLDVVLADREFARDNEDMAIAFIQADRAADNHELGRLSDVELLREQSAYQKVRTRRMISEMGQRQARSRLAIAMGRPEDLVSDVVPPPMPDLAAPQPGYEELLQSALQHSAYLRALRAAAESARHALEAARASGGVVVSAEAEAAWYQRPSGSSHPLAAGLLLELPFDTDGARQAEIARVRARQRRAEAALALAEQELRQEILELWQRLDARRIELAELDVLAEYRELYLDRSRALYEMEVKADLGDAMTEISEVRLRLGQAQFDWMMAKAKLDALTGRALTEGERP